MPKIIIINEPETLEPEENLGDWRQVADCLPLYLREALSNHQKIED